MAVGGGRSSVGQVPGIIPGQTAVWVADGLLGSQASSGPGGANPTATIGTAAVNGSATTFMRSDAAPAIPQASSSTFGAVKVDGTSITAAAGVISAAGSTPANPTATIGTTAVNGTATTFMRSDAAPAIPEASSSVFGAVKVDGTSITAAAGIISAPSTYPVAESAIAASGAATLDALAGIITSESLTGATTYTLTLTNSFVDTTAAVLCTPFDGAATGVQIVSITPGTGSVVIVLAMAALTGTVTIPFVVFPGMLA